MERPERPSRHKSNPVKFPIRPSFSSDSESEPNDNDVPIQITYYQPPPESANSTGGPSTSTVDANQSSADTSSNMMRISPIPLRVTLSPIPISSREEEPRTNLSQDSGRRKRSAAALTASSAAASVIFDSVDSLIGHNSSSQTVDSLERPLERFQHSDYVIRPRSFCNIDYSNGIRPPVYKMKRPNGPIDLTPSTSNRDSTCQAPVVTSSFSLRDTSALPSTTDTTQINYYNNRTSGAGPYIISPSADHQSSNSSILRRFDELCSSSSPIIRRRSRAYNVRFHEGGLYNEGSNTDVLNSNPLITRESSRSRNSSALDDYCDLVGNFLFNYPPLNNSDNQRPQLPPERTAVADPQSSTTANIINRHINTTSDIINNERSIINNINSYLDSTEATRNDIDETGEAMDVPNDDVIVVETPEQSALPRSSDTNMIPSSLPGSPDPDLVPSSRSPSPMPFSTSSNSTQNKRDKAQSVPCGEMPMTLQELNQTLVSLLECPVCLDHATPPIFQCCKGHILCQNCHPRLSTCPICRSRLPGDRNSAMEKVAEKLMYPCKNTVTGCSMMLKLDDKQEHEEGCGFRHYACIVTSCHWKGYKPELVVHLQSNHPEKLINGTTKEVQVPLAVPVGSTVMFIAHHWIQSAHNEVFNVIFHIDLYKRIMKGCVIYIGPPDKADKFTYLFELKQRVPPFRKLTYSRTTHADTLKSGQPLCLNNDFSINIDMARLYRPTECTSQNIPIFITILQVE